MTKCDFYLKVQELDASKTKIKITTIQNTEVVGIIDKMHEEYVLIDETCAFGDMVVIYYKDIKEVAPIIEGFNK